MADASAFLQGSQTGGILQNLNQPQQAPQSYIPSIPGAQPQGYTPGQGTAPYAQQSNPLDASQYTGLTPYEQQKLASLASGHDNFMKDQFLAGIANKSSIPNYQTGSVLSNGTGTMSSTPSQPGSSPTTSPAGTPASNNGITTIGQGNSWMSPDQMRAATNALQLPADPNSSSGGGGSGGSSGPGIGGNAGKGLNLSGTQGSAGANGGNPAFTNSNTPVSPTIGYQDPGGISSTPTVGYTGASQGGGVQGQSGVLQMQPANGQAALDAYQNTPGYQMLGNNQTSQYEQSPGYQYAMDQAMNQVQNRASATGMLDSGATLKSMQQTASGLAQQDYGNWWNRQNQLYTQYQNGLQGLAAGPTGSADAMTAGANGAQANLQTSSNLGSLFGNQGTAGTGAIINTGAAQSGNMINAGQQQAQVQTANQATQLAGATLASNQQAQNKGLF